MVKPLNGFNGGTNIYMMTKDYLKVTFQNGRATTWTATGINYTVKKFSPARTVICFLGTCAASVGFVMLMSFE